MPGLAGSRGKERHATGKADIDLWANTSKDYKTDFAPAADWEIWEELRKYDELAVACREKALPNGQRFNMEYYPAQTPLLMRPFITGNKSDEEPMSYDACIARMSKIKAMVQKNEPGRVVRIGLQNVKRSGVFARLHWME